ncbi:energy transducer TonB [Flavobacterium sp. DG1-102-2]|uniref:energy transducer TonB n=1 Tax=Flavobacterium sp. DG1-102-2 TaxID=3081663 RepID=UPI0029496217|nr:energy transducer TonB [Flavobacterium sp. DG1-102-2]MDV6168090.1 energy transducer TonB [Flavobacterium sp. DG1-102-2]
MKKLFLAAFILHFTSGIAQTTTLDSLIKVDFLFMKELMTSPLPGISVSADYPGGVNNFLKELKEKLSKASLKKLNRLKQKSQLNFTIEKDGNLSDINIYTSNDKKLIRDIEQSVKLMQKWYPAIENGKALRVQMSLPLTLE